MNLSKYQAQAFKTAQIDWNDPAKRHIPAFGVIGELGSLVSELKKSLRDGAAYTDGGVNLTEEFGDVLWYLAALCSRYGFDLADLVEQTPALKIGKERFGHVYAMVQTIPLLTKEFEKLPARPTSSQRRALAKNIGLSARVTLQALKAHRLSLGKVLDFNLVKVQSMFGPNVAGPARCFDGPDYPAYERLPRKLPIQFLERERGKERVEVILRVGDLNIGDRLTDNAAIDDGYRYHDAFHLAYVAVLGWSPVTRAILRCKRKSDPQKDEIEDGARAIIVEEAIAHTVFNYALGHSMLEGLDRLDHNLLKLIGRMVRNLEVKACQLHEWQRAVLTGFKAFRALSANHGGWLLLDAETQSLTYSREGPGAA
ncbi:MAG: nucleoside triphosphate pyrophosphohydrolase family protein [Dongiaceae bacterium]